MLRLLPLLLLLVGAPALASDPRGGPVAQACKRTHQTCRDGCAVDWGASMSQRARLAHCFKNCDRDESTCRERALMGPGAQKAPRPAPFREEKPKSRYAAPQRGKAPGNDRAVAGPAPGKSRGSAPAPLNVGAPDWLDDSPSKKSAPTRPASAPAAAAAQPAPARSPALQPLPTLPPAGREAPLEDAPLDDLHAAEKDPLESGTFEDDLEPDDAWGTGAAPAKPAAPRAAPPVAPPVDRAEAEELLPLDDGPLEVAPAKAGPKELAPARAGPAPRSPSPSKAEPMAPKIQKKRDISDWDPN